MSRFQVKKVAVLGAGVMGAQIAAHLVNVKVPVVLFDLPAKEGPKNGIVTRAVEGLKKLKPSPLGVADDAALIGQANYEEHLEQLRDCDLIIEAIAERMDWKLDLYKKIALAKLDSGDNFYKAKLATARFYFARLLPETAMLIRQARSGAKPLLDLEAELF